MLCGERDLGEVGQLSLGGSKGYSLLSTVKKDRIEMSILPRKSACKLPSWPFSGPMIWPFLASWPIKELCSQTTEFICEMELTLFIKSLCL